NKIYAVGANSTILRSTDGGATWPGLGSVPVSAITLNAVHCLSDGTNCWAVGASGNAWRYNPGTNAWEIVANSKTANTLRDVWVVAANDVWAVGLLGTVIHFDGTRWYGVPKPTGEDLNWIQMISATEGYMAGGGSSAPS